MSSLNADFAKRKCKSMQELVSWTVAGLEHKGGKLIEMLREADDLLNNIIRNYGITNIVGTTPCIEFLEGQQMK